jgi:hypothetical protein
MILSAIPSLIVTRSTCTAAKFRTVTGVSSDIIIMARAWSFELLYLTYASQPMYQVITTRAVWLIYIAKMSIKTLEDDFGLSFLAEKQSAAVPSLK